MSAATPQYTQSIHVTTTTFVPESGSIEWLVDPSWGLVSQSTCTVTGLSSTSDGTAVSVVKTSPLLLTITSFGDIASGTDIVITCENMTGPTSPNGT